MNTVEFYTSYYGNTRYMPDEYFKVGISNITPFGIHIYHNSYLAPSNGLLRLYKDGKLSEEEYIAKFRDQLHWTSETLLKTIDNLVRFVRKNGKDKIVLLCYEKPEDFCHRHIVAEYLTEHGYSCKGELPRFKKP